MQQETTTYRRMISGVGRLLAMGQRGGGMGMLMVLLLFLAAAGQDTLETLVPLGTDESVEALRQVVPGDLDTSFSGDGKVRTQFLQGSFNEAITAVALQPNGKIVVAGTTNKGDHNVLALARFRSNGSREPTFGDHGTVTTDFGTGATATAYAMALQPDGKIVAAGGVFFTDHSSFALARFRSNGSLDPTFGDHGTVTTDFENYKHNSAYAMALQPDGKIVAAGASDNSINFVFTLARYLPTGAQDPTFGDHGTVMTIFETGGGAAAYALALQPDGKIVVAGYSGDAFALARYQSDGALDPAFGRNGKVITTFNGYSSWFAALALQPDGKIVAAGTFQITVYNSAFALARYLPTGALDPAFGDHGIVTTNFESDSYDFATALALQPDGKIVVAGASGNAFVLARYRFNGSLDPAFGINGKVTTKFDANVESEGATALAIQPRDGRIVAAGDSSGPDLSAIVLARYHAFTCDGAGVTRIGTTGGDVIVGTTGNDVIAGLRGNDILIGLGGNDILCGDSGNDILLGGKDNDRLLGGPGADICDGGTHGQGDTALDCEQITGVP